MKIIDNKLEKFGDDIKGEMKIGDKLYIASAVFSMYGYEELKAGLKIVDEFNFIFTNPTFLKQEKANKQERKFEIDNYAREKSVVGSEFEIKLKNKLNGKAIAKECADWIREKVTFISNITNENMMGFINLDEKSYMPVNGFTTVELGCERGNNAYMMIQKAESPFSAAYLDLFEKMSGIEKKSIQRWIPIVAATQMTKKIPEEQEFLSKWINVVDYE